MINAELLSNAAKNVWTIIFNFKMARHIFSANFNGKKKSMTMVNVSLLVKKMIVDFHFGECPKLVRKQQTGRWNVHKFGNLEKRRLLHVRIIDYY